MLLHLMFQFFNEVDREGEGQVDVAYLLMVTTLFTTGHHPLTGAVGSKG